MCIRDRIGTRPASPESPGKAAFLDLLAANGLEEGLYSAEAYDAAKLALMAIDEAGADATKEAIRDALISVANGYVGASGDKTFDKNGDVGGTYSIWRIVSGAFVDIGNWDPSGVKIN